MNKCMRQIKQSNDTMVVTLVVPWFSTVSKYVPASQVKVIVLNSAVAYYVDDGQVRGVD